MIGLPTAVRIYLYSVPIDLRKGFDALAALVRAAGGDPFSGHLWVFLSRRAHHVKILTFDRGGFVVWFKRLEAGCFRFPSTAHVGATVSMDAGQLALLLDGIDYARVRRPPRWAPRGPE